MADRDDGTQAQILTDQFDVFDQPLQVELSPLDRAWRGGRTPVVHEHHPQV